MTTPSQRLRHFTRAFRPALWLLFAGLLCASLQAQTAPKVLTRPAQAGPLPAGAAPLDRQVTVMLKLADDPVAVVRGRAPGKKLSASDKDAIAGQLRNKQDAMIPTIEARGGKVRSQLQHAVNGIVVTVPASQLAALATIPGVVAVKPLLTYHPTNSESVPFIGGDATWGDTPGFRGEGIKIAIVDTGIDYTHANFGGPGTAAAFAAASAASTAPADPSMFGAGAPKVKGGTDLVGDAYNGSNVPQRDPNPLDCNGHGSHTSGTAAGFGVKSDGTTFHGPYDNSTTGRSFIIGPGVAPLADLYSVRVFGCSGSTNVVTEAIDWAVAHDMDVISMSLGAEFGSEDTADAEAAENAQEAGVIVVAAAGNAGNIPYITATPASGDKTISVAAMDSHGGFPGANVTLSTGPSLAAIDANGAHFADGTSLGVVVLMAAPGVISLGCNPAEYTAAVAGKLVVTQRGTCARVDRAIYGQQAGAAAVLMVNNAAALPPYEGPITQNPDTGVPYNVTIPFFGVSSSAAAALIAANGGSATLANTSIANPGFRHLASFTSSGARTGDGHLKPDVSAPGVSVFSTAVGTGSGGLFESGTSMATPHVAGVAALALQAHPTWDSDDVRKAVVNTADPSQLAGYIPRLGGGGLVQAMAATRTDVVATSGNDETSVSFGVAEFSRGFSDTREIRLRNFGTHAATFSVAATPVNGSPHTVSASSSTITVGPGGAAKVRVSLSVPAATAGDLSAFREVAGLVTFTPATPGNNNGVALTVPYYLVPRARSIVETDVNDDFGPRRPHTLANIRNESRSVAGTADFYAWSLRGANRAAGDTGLRAVGVQAFDGGPGLGQVVVFAVNTFKRWSNPSAKEFDILIDVNGDGSPDYDVFTLDYGLLTTGAFSGEVVSFVQNLHSGSLSAEFDATAPTDGSTILIPVLAADIGLTSSNPRFRYSGVQAFDLTSGSSDALAGSGGFNVFTNSITTSVGATLAPLGRTQVPVSISPSEWAQTPALGLMVVGMENANQANQEEDGGQAQLIPVGRGERHEGER